MLLGKKAHILDAAIQTAHCWRSVWCRWGLISWICIAQNNERQSLVLPLTLLE